MTFDASDGVAAPGAETVEIAVAPRTTSLVLEIQDEAAVRRVPLGGAPVIVGKGQGADIVVHDPTVSGRHCSIAARDGGVAVKDLGSRNGTYLGGVRVHEAWGAEGSTIFVGRTSIVCLGAIADDGEELGEPLPGIAGASGAMCRVAAQVRRLARLRAPVLVAGETGVGKELIARALHREGPRRDGAFVALNVAALPRELVESELFGHERGAFTGAVARRAGAFTEAEGGTLFLDEIGELPLDAQPKLLRALDGYAVRRLGGAGSGEQSDARVVAATHVPLLEHVEDGRFRRDLYHRLEVFVIELPPLRARRGDILPIARTLLDGMAGELGPRELTPPAVALLSAYDWPGNVRELRNVLLRAASVATCERWIDASAVARALRRSQVAPPMAALHLTPAGARDWLVTHGGNVSAAARAARMPRTTFRKLLGRAAGDAP
jgi:DNA-binding NtrC family response regulator